MSIFQITWLQTWLGQEVRNTFYYETSVGDPSVSEWQDIVDEIRADFVTAGANNWSDTWAFYGIDYRKVSSAGLLSFRALPTLGDFDGSGTEDPVPTQIALLVSLKGTTTKPNRARSYLAGMKENVMTDSLWAASIVSAMETLIDLQSDLNAGGTNPLQRVAAQWNTSHTMVTASNNIAGSASEGSVVPATQRRRRIGVGM